MPTSLCSPHHLATHHTIQPHQIRNFSSNPHSLTNTHTLLLVVCARRQDSILPDANKVLEAHPLPVPAYAGITIKDPVASFGNGCVDVLKICFFVLFCFVL